MENHKEKLAIFNQYAEIYGYADFEELLFDDRDLNQESRNSLMIDIFKITDIVQKEALKKASNRGCDSLELYKSEYLKLESSILSDENFVK